MLWKNTRDDAVYARLRAEFANEWRERRPPLVLADGIEVVLRELSRHYRLGILGQYGTELASLLGKRQLLDHFSFRATQEEFELTKPDPRYFEGVLDAAGAAPRESLMVGDRIDKDVIPAKAVGMKTIRVICGMHRKQRPRTPEERPDAEVAAVSGLPELFSARNTNR